MCGKKQQNCNLCDSSDLKLKMPGLGPAQVLDQLVQGQFNQSTSDALSSAF